MACAGIVSITFVNIEVLRFADGTVLVDDVMSDWRTAIASARQTCSKSNCLAMIALEKIVRKDNGGIRTIASATAKLVK